MELAAQLAANLHVEVAIFDSTMTTTIEKKRGEAFAKAFRRLPKRITCPKCTRTRAKEAFGLRVTKKTEAGVPLIVKPQSWCRECRTRR